MSDMELELISPDRLKKTCQKDWKLQFIYEIEKTAAETIF